jgi:hypothetical protein
MSANMCWRAYLRLDLTRVVCQTSRRSLLTSIKFSYRCSGLPYKGIQRIRKHTCARLHRFELVVLHRHTAFAKISPLPVVLLRRAAQRRVPADNIYGMAF